MRHFLKFVAILVVIISAVLPASAAYTPTANGCGPEGGISVPNYYYLIGWFRIDKFPFVNACNAHDICYGTLGSSRASCDSRFYSNLLAICSANASTSANRVICNGLAWTYYEAVHLFGQSAFDAAQARARQG